MSILGRTFFFDTSVLGTDDIDWNVLLGYASGEWIDLRRASAVGDDLARDTDSARAAALEEEGSFPEATGPFVIDESRIGSAFLTTAAEARDFAALFALVFPGTDPQSTSRTASNKRRDVMHLATVLKYGGDGLITRDSGLLRKADVLISTFSIGVLAPKTARDFVDRLRRRFEIRGGSDGQRSD